MKKKMSIMSMVFQLCALLALFLPFNWVEEYWKYGSSTGGFTKSNTYMQNFFNGKQYGIGFWGPLTVIVMVLSAVVIALFIADKIKQKLLFVTAIPTVCLIAAVLIRDWTTFTSSGQRVGLETQGMWEFNVGWLLYIVIALQIAVTVLSVLTALGVFKDALPRESTQNTAQTLAEYKKLLDDGAITQQEYDAKKKQLLGL